MVGHDTGYIIGHALAADHPDRIDRVVLAAIAGSPGVAPSPPLFVPEPLNNRLWHIPFNRVNDELTEQLVRGREDIFFGYEFAIQSGQKGLPEYLQRYYFGLFSDPDTLHGSFGLYRAWDTTLARSSSARPGRWQRPRRIGHTLVPVARLPVGAVGRRVARGWWRPVSPARWLRVGPRRAAPEQPSSVCEDG